MSQVWFGWLIPVYASILAGGLWVFRYRRFKKELKQAKVHATLTFHELGVPWDPNWTDDEIAGMLEPVAQVATPHWPPAGAIEDEDGHWYVPLTHNDVHLFDGEGSMEEVEAEYRQELDLLIQRFRDPKRPRLTSATPTKFKNKVVNIDDIET